MPIDESPAETSRARSGNMSKSARVYTVFASRGLFGSTQTYSLHHSDGRVLSNEEILSEIKRRCAGVESVGSTDVEEPGYAVVNTRACRQSIDGVLYFGSVPAEVTELDVPVVAVYPLWGQWQEPFNSYPQSRQPYRSFPMLRPRSSRRGWMPLRKRSDLSRRSPA